MAIMRRNVLAFWCPTAASAAAVVVAVALYSVVVVQSTRARTSESPSGTASPNFDPLVEKVAFRSLGELYVRSLSEQQGTPLTSSMEYFFGDARDVHCADVPGHDALPAVHLCASPPGACKHAVDVALGSTQKSSTLGESDLSTLSFKPTPPSPTSLPVLSSYAQLLGKAPLHLASDREQYLPGTEKEYCLLEATQHPRLTRWENITFLSDDVCGNLTRKYGSEFPDCQSECLRRKWTVHQICVDEETGDPCELELVCQPSERALEPTVDEGNDKNAWGECGVAEDACGGLVARTHPAFIASFVPSGQDDPFVYIAPNGHTYTSKFYYNPPDPCAKYEPELSKYSTELNATLALDNVHDAVYVTSQFYVGVYEMMAQTLPRLMWAWPILQHNPSIKIHMNFPEALAPMYIQYLDILGIPEERLVRGNAAAKVVYVPEMACALDRQSNWGLSMQLLQKTFRNNVERLRPGVISARKTILVVRREGRRRIENHNELVAMIEEQIDTPGSLLHRSGLALDVYEAGAPPWDPSYGCNETGPLDTLSRFYNAEVVIGPHGSGFSNMIAAREGASVIDILLSMPSEADYAKDPNLANDPAILSLVFADFVRAIGQHHYSMTQSLIRPSAYTAQRLDDSMEAYYMLNLEEMMQNINRVLQEQGLA